MHGEQVVQARCQAIVPEWTRVELVRVRDVDVFVPVHAVAAARGDMVGSCEAASGVCRDCYLGDTHHGLHAPRFGCRRRRCARDWDGDDGVLFAVHEDIHGAEEEARGRGVAWA